MIKDGTAWICWLGIGNASKKITPRDEDRFRLQDDFYVVQNNEIHSTKGVFHITKHLIYFYSIWLAIDFPWKDNNNFVMSATLIIVQN